MVPGCLAAGALTVTFVHRAIMGWPRGVEPFNLRDVDLLARTSDQVAFVNQRSDCSLCGMDKVVLDGIEPAIPSAWLEPR
jgi:hypothetical protein